MSLTPQQDKALARLEDMVAANCPDYKMCYRQIPSIPLQQQCRWCVQLLEYLRCLRLQAG